MEEVEQSDCSGAGGGKLMNKKTGDTMLIKDGFHKKVEIIT